ncbi:hypothetical protein [[Flexibacter] sp. ATCC 35208]|uniref:hypothetical protein n=1 Tax=[Flexibacter] sp. ATCC 35208 TaxID=1936242 RepID=UPI0009CF74D8|nr:hypothetical protein [[Flexibacter] sp. ATCC 35208]OMP75126.1 hypothetical protein BW716_31845 [[Flexibacter] sp. ATCC 35208]
MYPFANKYFTPQQINAFILSKGIEDPYVDLFREQVELYLKDVDENEDCSKEEWGESSLRCSWDYVTHYSAQLNRGHGTLWATYYAKECFLEDEEKAFTEAWYTIWKDDKSLALTELNIYCSGLDKDEFYKAQFIDAISNLCLFKEAHQLAEEWSANYHQKIKSGKSELHARLYADNAEIYSEIYAEKYASTYEQYLDQGKSEAYAVARAQLTAEKYNEHFFYTSTIEKEEQMNMEDAIAGHMIAWEYLRSLDLQQEARFIDIYNSVYLGRGDIPEIYRLSGTAREEKILEMALQRYNK